MNVSIDPIENLKSAIEFFKENGQYPSRTSKNREEKRLRDWIDDIYMYPHKMCAKEFLARPEVISLLKENNCEDIWEKEVPVNHMEYAQLVLDYFKENGKGPHYSSCYDGVWIGYWVNNCQYTAKGNYRAMQFPKDADKFLNENGMQGVLRPQQNLQDRSRAWEPGLGRGFSFDKTWKPTTTIKKTKINNAKKISYINHQFVI